MARLGDFGAQPEQVDDDDVFGYFGHDIRVSPELGELALVDFMEQALTIDETDPRAMLVVKDFLRSCVHPEDFEQFWGLARKNRQGTEDLLALAKAVVEAWAQRPTSPSSGSTPGPAPTGESSEGGSSSPAPSGPSVVVRRLEDRGRPDLALLVDDAERIRSAV